MFGAFLLSCDGESPVEATFPTLSGAGVVRRSVSHNAGRALVCRGLSETGHLGSQVRPVI